MKTNKKKIKTFDIINIFLMILMMFIMLYPFWFCLVGSFNEGNDYMKGGIYFWPRKFTVANYKAVFFEPIIYDAFMITIAKTVLGTITHVFFTAMIAYGISRKNLAGRNIYLIIIITTMYFGGGLIPYYVLLKELRLLDNFLVYIIPTLFSVWDMIIIQSFMREIPESLIESSKIDGASEYKIFYKIILPLSKPVLAAIALFTMVGHWNSYFDSMLFTNSQKLQTIQVYLKKVITDAGTANGLGQNAAAQIPEAFKQISPQTIKLAAMMITAVPIIMIYPFLQKYFIKGVMIGSIKG